MPSLDYTLSFHIGLMARVAARRELSGSEAERELLLVTSRKLLQAGEALDEADEAEEFQSVGTSQLAIERSDVVKKESVALLEKDRSRIAALREQVEKSRLSSPKKQELIRKLTEIELALVQRRVNMGAVALVMIAILTVPGDFEASREAVGRLVMNVLETVGEAKAVEDEQRLLTRAPERPAIAPPVRIRAEGEVKERSFDDDIPF